MEDQEQLVRRMDIPEVPNQAQIAQMFQFSRQDWKAFLESKAQSLTWPQRSDLQKQHMNFVHRVEVSNVLDYLFGDGVLSGEEQEKILNCRQYDSNEESMRMLMTVLRTKGQRGYFSLLRALVLSTPQQNVASIDTQVTDSSQEEPQLQENGATASGSSASEEHDLMRVAPHSAQGHYTLDFHDVLCKVKGNTAPESELVVQSSRGPHFSASTWQAILHRHKVELSAYHRQLLLDHNLALVNEVSIDRVLPALVKDGMVDSQQRQVIMKKPSSQDGMRELLRVVRMRGEQGFLSLCKAVVETEGLSTKEQIGSYSAQLREFHEGKIRDEVSESRLEDISLYAPLTIVHGQDSRVVKRETYNVLEEANLSKQDDQTAEPKEIFLAKGDKENPRTLLVRGRGGIGKSTFLRKIIMDWAKQILWKDQFSATFRFQLKDLNLVTEELTCRELLQTYHGPCLSDKDSTQSWEYILENQDEILITFDGLDEFDLFEGKTDLPKLYDPNKKAPVANLIYNIQKGNLLPKANILFTSRPIATALKILNKFDRIVEIRGFDKQQREQHIRTLNSDDEGSAEYILGALKKDNNMASFCTIPIICTMFCTVLKYTRKMASNSDTPWHHSPRTMTQIFSLLVTLFMMEHHRDNNITHLEEFWSVLPVVRNTLVKLAKLAFEGLTKAPTKLVFNTSDLSKHNIAEEEAKTGLLTSRQVAAHPFSKTRNHLYSFSHLLYQEFLAAVHLTALPWKYVKDILEKGHAQQEMMMLYLGGLWGDVNTHDFLMKIHPELEGKSAELQESSRELLSFICAEEQSLCWMMRRRKVLSLMMLYETQAPALASAVKGTFNRGGITVLREERLTAIECRGLGFLLLHTENQLTHLHLDENEFGSAGLEELQEGIKYHSRTLKHLALCNCHLVGASSQQALGASLGQSAAVCLEALDLSGNPFLCMGGTDGLCEALKACTTLKKLSLRSCGLGQSSEQPLCASLTNTAGSLELLDLSLNPNLCKNGIVGLVTQLLPGCHSLSVLGLKDVGLSDADAIRLVDVLLFGCGVIRSLGLYGNRLSSGCKEKLREMVEGRFYLMAT